MFLFSHIHAALYFSSYSLLALQNPCFSVYALRMDTIDGYMIIFYSFTRISEHRKLQDENI